MANKSEYRESVKFLCSDKSSYMTGQNLLIDGGVTMSVISSLPRPEIVDSVGIKDSQKK
jgi:enoyl-[acyl-carrier-protein] reductase (NADH)